ncbi:hypothetical protein COY16_06245 [Candidatus Roizmanbacteria bacterium CG_4_10_14_0_2_um_filter_39_13]|uniref:Glycosyltransferase family 1 protein n=1 Tax=Candidatus Roizmanbacteria bacterium CG_4_10_14_0_2_um_filter_39_13 TaxID=1974825 RepID=A0A2M7TV47_9BACT|nr:MAG: hypothetical protein COY16_06245 [Candidatus Roizmanbacteria bacterium CG_4_10_14_0_2_um_filter_39_13]
MKVILDGHMVGTKEGGNARYVQNLYKALFDRRDIDVVLYTGDKNEGNLYRLCVGLPNMARKIHADIIHSTYISPFLKTTKTVITVHDFSFYRYPKFFTLREQIIFSTLLPWSINNADAIIVPTEFVKEESLEFSPKMANKTGVIHDASDPVFTTISKKKYSQYLIEKFYLKKKYYLCLSSVNPKKNIEAIIQGVRLLREHYSDFELVIAGVLPHGFDKSSVPPWVRILGFVSDHDLAMLYNGCEVFIYLPLYEGFGLPVLEALQSGAKVIGSRIPPICEVGGNAVTMVDPNSIGELVQVLKKLTTSSQTPKQQMLRRAVVKKYSWQKTADETVKIYKKILQ